VGHPMGPCGDDGGVERTHVIGTIPLLWDA
jgi:hypothetical protein